MCIEKVVGTVFVDIFPQTAKYYNIAATQELIVLQYSKNNNPTQLKGVAIDPSNPFKLVYYELNLTHFLKPNRWWISTNEKNTIYSIEINSIGDYNITVLNKHFFRLTKYFPVDFSEQATYHICEIDTNQTQTINFTLMTDESHCKHSQSFANLLLSFEDNFSGFTDQKYFYLFNKENVYTFNFFITNIFMQNYSSNFSTQKVNNFLIFDNNCFLNLPCNQFTVLEIVIFIIFIFLTFFTFKYFYYHVVLRCKNKIQNAKFKAQSEKQNRKLLKHISLYG